MLNWLKSLFGGGARPLKTADLEARLVAVDPSKGLHGDAEFEAWDNGTWEFEAEVEGPDGMAPPEWLRVTIDGVEIGDLLTRGDEAELKLRSVDSAMPATPSAGSKIEVHGPGGLMLTGTFQQDR